MLRTRVLTALVIASVIVPSIFLMNRLHWSILTAIVAGIAAWEFARLARFCKAGQWRYGAFVLAITMALAIGAPKDFFDLLALPVLASSAVFWLFVAPAWLRSRRELKSHLVLALVGLVLLLPTWVSLVLIQQFGSWWLVGAILLVAIADIAAYFFGKAFGKRKLAPNISPGKTWEGVWGAMATVTLICLLGAIYAGHSKLFLLTLALGVPLLTLVSIAGDLLESMLKRQAGLKDSSNLLPGHGGVMDRIDSHTAALPLIALVLVLLYGAGG
jgi:phosphatidate cytidylyltransferase